MSNQKNLHKVGLVLEGGGMRGVYTSGVLDSFIKNKIYFKFVIGVSAGASNGVSYISNQYQRNKVVNINYVKDSRFLSFKNLIKEKSLFGMDFLFNILPNQLEPFDYDSFFSSPMKFNIVATDCCEGKAVYFEKSGLNSPDLMTALKASTSIPYASPFIEFKGKKFLDGGIADSIPIEKSLKEGNKKNVVVLTRNAGYRKKPSSLGKFFSKQYSDYPKLVKSLEDRHINYNKSLDKLEELEKRGDVFIIRPQQEIKVGRLEKSKEKLLDFYEEGFEEVESCKERLNEWLESC